MGQCFNTVHRDGELISTEFSKRGVFFWKEIKFIIHHPIVETEPGTLGINPSIWTVSEFSRGVNVLRGLEPDMMFKEIQKAKDCTLSHLLRIGVKELKKSLKKHPIINKMDYHRGNIAKTNATNC